MVIYEKQSLDHAAEKKDDTGAEQSKRASTATLRPPARARP